VAGVYDLSGRLSLRVDDEAEHVKRFFDAQMDPFQRSTGESDAADVSLAPDLRRGTFVDVHNPARDGMVTASDGVGLFRVVGGLACAMPDALGDAPTHFAYEPGFPVARIFAAVVRPTLQLALLRHGCAAVHSAAVEIDGRAVLVAGWSESGKTEAALALMEQGARFLSDKWTVLGADGHASAFPIGVGVRRWVLPYLPRLAASLPRPAQARMRVAGAAASLSRPLRDRSRPGRMGELAQQAVTIADRAALSPSEVRAAYGQVDEPARRLPLTALAILTTVPEADVTSEPADPAWAAARLARSAAFERRQLFAVLDRRRYAFPLENGTPVETAVASERRTLESALDGRRVIEVRAPFPVDPNRVAAAVTRWL
jgi:hypothetical protein